MKPILFAAALLVAATPLAAAYASRDLIVPIAGHVVGADGRAYLTAIRITNVTDRPADLAMTFRPAPLHALPRGSSLQLAANETRVLDPFDVGGDLATGWLRIESRQELLVSARVYSRMANETATHTIATFSAIPSQFAIGNGESTLLQGVTPASARYKLYFDEIDGKPLEVWVTLLDLKGATIARTHLYVDANQQITKEVAELFPAFANGEAVLRVEGKHGHGKVIVAGSATAKDSQDASSFEMSFTPASRNRMSNAEIAAYIAVAAGVLAAVVARRR